MGLSERIEFDSTIRTKVIFSFLLNGSLIQKTFLLQVMKSKHGEGATFVAANCFRKSEVLENKTVAEKYGFGEF